jgi:Lrp/AsnC family leucine-responsive transcriptional regulator
VEVLADYAGPQESFAEAIEHIEGVTHLYSTMGETDFVAFARLPGDDSVGDLVRAFQQVPEVERTNSTYVIDTLHEDDRALSSYPVESLLDQLTDE